MQDLARQLRKEPDLPLEPDGASASAAGFPRTAAPTDRPGVLPPLRAPSEALVRSVRLRGASHRRGGTQRTRRWTHPVGLNSPRSFPGGPCPTGSRSRGGSMSAVWLLIVPVVLVSL